MLASAPPCAQAPGSAGRLRDTRCAADKPIILLLLCLSFPSFLSFAPLFSSLRFGSPTGRRSVTSVFNPSARWDFIYIYILTEVHFDFKYNIFQSGTKIFIYFFCYSFFFSLFKENPNSLTAVPAPWLRLGEQIPSHPFFASRSRFSHSSLSFHPPHFFSSPSPLARSVLSRSPLESSPPFPFFLCSLSTSFTTFFPAGRPRPLLSPLHCNQPAHSLLSCRSAFCFDLTELSFGPRRDPISSTANVVSL